MRGFGFLFALVGALLAAGAGRLVFLERTKGDELRALSEQQHTATLVVPAQRGDILDAKGRLLAGSVRKPSVFMDVTRIDDPVMAAYSVAPVLGLDPAALERAIREKANSGFVWVKRGLSDEELRQFGQVRHARKLDGFGVQYEPERVYPNRSTASHVLGFVGAPDDPKRTQPQGRAGVEQLYDAWLVGNDGRRVSTVDVRRRRLQAHQETFEAPLDGGTVILTIDAYIQQRTEEHLRRAVEEHKASWGTAVVMDVHGGEVLAMANYPDFDPSEPFPSGMTPAQAEQWQERHMRNRAISDSYEPGSIYKPFIAAPAYDEALVRLEDRFVINGPARQFGSRTIHDTHPYGTLYFWEVISKSSNIGMGILGARLGNGRLHRYVRSFGFGDPTGIGLPGEHEGLAQDFSIAITPIQLLTAFSVFANDGVLMRPRIVRGVIDSTGRPVEDNSRPTAIRRVLGVDAARTFRREALARVVLPGGTGTHAALSDYQVFGKTGTAQIAKPGGGGYLPNAYCGSFVCAAPLGEPRASVIVSIYHPTGGKYYGGTVAAPAAGAILADALQYMQVPPEPLLTAPTAGPASD
ncbi:MAG: penicillin-binding protein 2 [Planctomycetes bacterium]|nr:penicillin-binding protein 2 [Planctomycetota bacterium]